MSKDRWYRHEQRVRYAETDQMGVVYHANYLTWFEIGRTEWIREIGLSYRSIEDKGLLLPLVEAEVKFKQPARYDDRVGIYTRLSSYSGVRMEFAYEIRRWDEESRGDAGQQDSGLVPVGDLLVSGATRHVWVNPSWKPVRIDKEAPEIWRLLAGKA